MSSNQMELNNMQDHHHEAVMLVPGETTFSLAALEEIVSQRDLARIDEAGGLVGLARALKTDLDKGIPEAEAHTQWHDRRTMYGSNVRSQTKAIGQTILAMWFAKFKDATNLLLAILATVLLVLGIIPAEVLGSSPEEKTANWIDALGIYLAVLVAASVQTINQWASDQQWKALDKSRSSWNVKVIRGGIVTMVSKEEVMVGDVVVLGAGDRIPADGLFINGEGTELYVDESELSIESDLVRKSPQDPWMMTNSEVSEGSGSMLVIATGDRTQWAQDQKAAEDEPEDQEEEQLTPLQRRLNRLSLDIGKVGIVAAAAILVVLVFWWFYDEIWGQSWKWDKLPHLIRIFVMTLTIVVVAVPEGLPMAVTITLSYSVGHMLNDCDEVRSSESVETMASTTVLCLDKTGTLTENRPYVDRCYMAGIEFDPSDDRALRQLPPAAVNVINDSIALNSTAWVNSQYDRVGSALECALLEFAETRLRCKTRELRGKHPSERVFPFTSARMRMSTVIKKQQVPAPAAAPQSSKSTSLKVPGLALPTTHHAGYTLYIKGAPELILARSVRFLKSDGAVAPMTNEKRMTLGRKIDEWCARGLRVLGFATRDLPKLKNWHEPPEEDLTLTGFVAFVDPVRPNAANAILACQRAGVRATLFTGENIITATTIARQVGLLRPGFKTGLQSLLATLKNENELEDSRVEKTEDDFVLEGPEFEELDTSDLDRVIHRIRVVARASPVDKYRIVERLKSAGEIVAVTGDSPNDEAALRKAEVGLALGAKGSEVAKRASDIVVVDNDITSIMRAIMWGRNVYDNVRKFLQFQLAVAFVVTVTAFIGALSKYGMPLTSVQMIWINIIMDTMAGLALGSEKPTPTLLNRKPYRRKSGLITKAMLRNIFVQGLIQCIVFLVVLYAGAAIFGLDEVGYEHPTKPTTHYTMVFTSVIFFTIFYQINCRRVTEWNIFKSIHANWRFGVIILATVLVQIVLVEFCGPFIRTTPLTLSQWLWCVGLGATALPIGFAVRFIPIPYEDFEKATSDADKKQLDFLAHRSKREAFQPVFKPLEINSDVDNVL